MGYENIENLSKVLEESKNHVVMILKHSNICPISTSAKHEVDKYLVEHRKNVYFVIVQRQRDLSNQIAEILGVKHESPQLLFVKNGVVVHVLNHDDITQENIKGIYL